MLPYDDLPIILVSAATESAAAKIISDIIDNEVSELQCNENTSLHRVWRIVNKYYTADVRLRPFTDDEPSLPQLDNIEAHIVYLTEEECAGSDESMSEICEARVRRVGSAGRHADVRLVAAESSALSESLVITATRLHLELVPLRLEPSQYHDDEEDKEDYGLTRVRAALHAHTWSGLKLSAVAATPPSPLTYRDRRSTGAGGESSSSGGDGEESEEECEAEAVERAEAFAAALGGVRGAAEQCATLGGAERARRAQLLLAELCRALGHRLDDC